MPRTKTQLQSSYFTPALFHFLRELKRNNRRDWFHANKRRYEEEVKEPALRFITDFAPHLGKISRYFLADPRPVGGLLFRIYRDIRFAKNKDPYKTHTGVHFRHEVGKNAHAPGFYLHLEPGHVFAGVGIWCPDNPTLTKIRNAIVADPQRWRRSAGGRQFTERYEMRGEKLKRPPRGFDPEHPLCEDLKWKSFTGLTRLTQKDVTAADFPQRLESVFRAGSPLVKFLCEAIGVGY